MNQAKQLRRRSKLESRIFCCNNPPNSKRRNSKIGTIEFLVSWFDFIFHTRKEMPKSNLQSCNIEL